MSTHSGRAIGHHFGNNSLPLDVCGLHDSIALLQMILAIFRYDRRKIKLKTGQNDIKCITCKNGSAPALANQCDLKDT